MTSNKREQHVTGKLLTNFKHLKKVSIFLLILDNKKLTYKISEERRIAIASLVELGNVSSNLCIIMLCSITYLIFKYKSP